MKVAPLSLCLMLILCSCGNIRENPNEIPGIISSGGVEATSDMESSRLIRGELSSSAEAQSITSLKDVPGTPDENIDAIKYPNSETIIVGASTDSEYHSYLKDYLDKNEFILDEALAVYNEQYSFFHYYFDESEDIVLFDNENNSMKPLLGESQNAYYEEYAVSRKDLSRAYLMLSGRVYCYDFSNDSLVEIIIEHELRDGYLPLGFGLSNKGELCIAYTNENTIKYPDRPGYKEDETMHHIWLAVFDDTLKQIGNYDTTTQAFQPFMRPSTTPPNLKFDGDTVAFFALSPDFDGGFAHTMRESSVEDAGNNYYSYSYSVSTQRLEVIAQVTFQEREFGQN